MMMERARKVDKVGRNRHLGEAGQVIHIPYAIPTADAFPIYRNSYSVFINLSYIL